MCSVVLMKQSFQCTSLTPDEFELWQSEPLLASVLEMVINVKHVLDCHRHFDMRDSESISIRICDAFIFCVLRLLLLHPPITCTIAGLAGLVCTRLTSHLRSVWWRLLFGLRGCRFRGAKHSLMVRRTLL